MDCVSKITFWENNFIQWLRIYSSVLFFKSSEDIFTDLFYYIVETEWESVLEAEEEWESVQKVEKVWESVLKVEKVWESVLNVEKVC